MFVKSVLGEKRSRTWSVSPDDTILTTLQLFDHKKIGFAVVMNKEGNPQGGISERDICKAMSHPEGAGRLTPVRDVMVENVPTCTPDDNLVRVMALMTKQKDRHMLVMEEDQLRGVISIGDVVKHRLDEILHEEEELLKYIDGTGYTM